MGRKVDFSVGYFYHIYNRGVDKRVIFSDESDYFRFIETLYFFNDDKPTDYYHLNWGGSTSTERDRLVGILCYCLMPNHFHFILTPLKEKGIQKFMQKISTGYAMYFNEKYKRSGSLFEGRYKAILIDSDGYFTHLTRYIHLNPVKLLYPDWKEKSVKWKEIEKFLKGYKWSSLPFYLKIKKESNILDTELIKNHLVIKPGEEYERFIGEDRPPQEDLCSIDRK